ncbi:hypothetical protein GALMADRAFT_161913 [Galerina marginata CBS 339.88]|uniref:Uncharacterized protein n=1 Tax=Galerina marginata (strain CBS 339.88) TaxID=685588 RepID=A0A067S7F1_GALM3|nr:hypothetical protein GALMADRAFT_161913 [Galerina marginata CBS 339.88]
MALEPRFANEEVEETVVHVGNTARRLCLDFEDGFSCLQKAISSPPSARVIHPAILGLGGSPIGLCVVSVSWLAVSILGSTYLRLRGLFHHPRPPFLSMISLVIVGLGGSGIKVNVTSLLFSCWGFQRRISLLGIRATSSLPTVASRTYTARAALCVARSLYVLTFQCLLLLTLPQDCPRRLNFEDPQHARPFPRAPSLRRYHRLSNLRNSIAKLDHPFFFATLGLEVKNCPLTTMALLLCGLTMSKGRVSRTHAIYHAGIGASAKSSSNSDGDDKNLGAWEVEARSWDGGSDVG